VNKSIIENYPGITKQDLLDGSPFTVNILNGSPFTLTYNQSLDIWHVILIIQQEGTYTWNITYNNTTKYLEHIKISFVASSHNNTSTATTSSTLATSSTSKPSPETNGQQSNGLIIAIVSLSSIIALAVVAKKKNLI